MQRLILLAATLGALTVGRPAFATDVPSDKLLPPGALFYLSIPNGPAFRERFGESSFGQLVRDDAFTDLREEFQGQLEELEGQLQEELGYSIEDLLTLPQGELAIAGVSPGGQSFSVVLLLDFGDRRDTIDNLIEKATESAEEEGAERSVRTVGGTDIILFTDDEDEPAGTRGPERSAGYFVRDTTLVVSNSATALESVIERWAGDSDDTLADSDVYSYIRERTNPEGNRQPMMVWYVDPVGAVRAGIAAASRNAQGGFPATAGMFLGFLPALGLDKLKGMGGTMDMATEDYNTISRSLYYVEQPATGLLRVFHFPPAELSPPDWVSADATTYVAANWDVDGAYRAVETLFDYFQGPGSFKAIMDQAAQAPDGPNIHPKDDVVDQLTGRIQFVAGAGDPNELGDETALVVLGIKDGDRALASVRSILSANGEVSERDFQGVTVLESEFARPDGEEGLIGVAAKGGQLYVSSDMPLLESALRGETEEPLAESEAYQRIAGEFPDQVSILSYARSEANIRAAYEGLRSGQFEALLEGRDFGFLPEFEEIEKYFGITGSYAVPDENGVLSVSFGLRSEELED